MLRWRVRAKRNNVGARNIQFLGNSPTLVRGIDHAVPGSPERLIPAVCRA